MKHLGLTVIVVSQLGMIGCGSIGSVSHTREGQSPGTTTSSPDSAADQKLASRVQAALHSDPNVYDQHITVSVEGGNVVLRGFVLSDWDLQNAKKIASQAAGDRRVVDNLSIKEGGRR